MLAKCRCPLRFLPEFAYGAAAVSPVKTRKIIGIRKAAGPRTEEDILFDRLRQLRAGLAEQRHCPPYMIFGDKVLRELARQRPMCVQDAMEIKGIGQVKIHTVLPYFLREIQNWCNGH